MTWVVTLYPEDNVSKPRVLDEVIKYEILNIVTGRAVLKFAVFTLSNSSHITVIFDVGSRKDQIVYRKFEIYNTYGNFIAKHRAANNQLSNYSRKLF